MRLFANIIYLCALVTHTMCKNEEQLTEGLGMPMDEVVTRMKNIFTYIDKNADGNVTYEESVTWMKKINNKIMARTVRVEMDALDENKDGVVTVKEIYSKYGPEQEQDPLFLEKLETRVKAVDVDGDGAINSEEAERFLYPSTDPELVALDAEDIIQQQDTNGDGKISKKEFIEHLRTESEEDQERLSEDFDQYDANKDGNLDKEELTTILLEPKDTHVEDVKTLWANMVGSENSTLTLEEYLTNVTQWAVSHMTDMGEVLRFPRQFDLDMENIDTDTDIDTDNDNDIDTESVSASEEDKSEDKSDDKHTHKATQEKEKDGNTNDEKKDKSDDKEKLKDEL